MSTFCLRLPLEAARNVDVSLPGAFWVHVDRQHNVRDQTSTRWWGYTEVVGWIIMGYLHKPERIDGTRRSPSTFSPSCAGRDTDVISGWINPHAHSARHGQDCQSAESGLVHLGRDMYRNLQSYPWTLSVLLCGRCIVYTRFRSTWLVNAHRCA